MKKFYYVELLRFFSAFAVLIYNYQHFFKPHSTVSTIDIAENKFIQPFYSFLKILYHYGNYGVPMFWAISGFVFAFVYLNREKKTNGKKFFVNRFSRLYPLHFATLLIVTLFQIINYKSIGSYQIFQTNDFYHFFLHIFFISGWGFENNYAFNGPIWSVSIELVIYFFFFFSIIYLNKYKVKFTLLIYLIFLILDKSGFFNYEGGSARLWHLSIGLNLLLDCGRLFFSGIFIFYLYEIIKNKLYLILTSLLLIFLSCIGNFKIFLFFPSILLLFVALEIFIHDKFKNIFEFLGNLTYALYLLHIPVQLLIIFVFSSFGILSQIFINNYFFILYVLLMILLSSLCFAFYEKPLSNKIRSRLTN